MTDLTPESEYLVATIDEDTTLDELRSHLAAIEAAAIARDREGLVERVAQHLCDYMREMSSDPWRPWDDLLPEARALWLEDAATLLALDAPEAQA
jgi:cob(I)alamin adenosyltransferase